MVPRLRFLLLSSALVASVVHGQFIAFNDHNARAGWTHSNTTSYSFYDYPYPSTTNSVEGQLKNSLDGEFVPARVRIVSVSTTGPSPNSYGFAPDTPAAEIFGSTNNPPVAVDFVDYMTRLVSGSVTHTFFGLNPDRKYQFIGTAIYGFPD